jgi:hypothetical protein
VISTIPSCANHQQILLRCTKWAPELKKENLVQPKQVKLSMGFQPNFTGVSSTIPSCAHGWHNPFHCTKWQPELKIEKSCPAFTGQTTDGISTKLYMSDKYTPLFCTSPASFPSLNIMAAKA